jgi:hypothetical protein
VSTPPQPDLTGDPIRSQVPAADPPHYAGHTPGYGPNPTAQGVRGYRDLAPEEIDTINQVKFLQESVARVWAVICARPGVDIRKVQRARDHFEEGFSALVGSIAQPHDPFLSALRQLGSHSATSGPETSTVDQNSAQPSHDPRPDEGSRP